jgi:hypothetical protein
MKRQVPRAIAIRSFAMVVALGVACQAQAQDAKVPYALCVPGISDLHRQLM